MAKRWLKLVASAVVAAHIGLTSVPKALAAAITSTGFEVNGTCEAGNCSPSPLSVSQSENLALSITTTLANGDMFQITGAAASTNAYGGVNLSSGAYSVQYIGDGHGGPSQQDTINTTILRSLASPFSATFSDDFTGFFSGNIAPHSTVSATLNGQQIGTTFNSSTSPDRFGDPTVRARQTSTGVVTNLDRTNSVTFAAGSPRGSYVTYDVALPPPTPPQVVYLDFAADTTAVVGPGHTPYFKPDAGLSQEAINIIKGEVEGIYANYNVSFTTIKPGSGPFDTIYIGGTPDIVQNSPIRLANKAGIASDINLNNLNNSDSAAVFSGLNYFYLACIPNTNTCTLPIYINIAQTIAHELGHILGLSHVFDSHQLLFPGTASTAVTIGVSSSYAAIDRNGNIVRLPGMQDSNAVLLCNLGGSYNQLPDCNLASSGGFQYIDLSFGNLAQTLFDAQLNFLTPDGDDDSGPPTLTLGTVLPNTEETLRFPTLPYTGLTLRAATSEGGALEELAYSFASSDASNYTKIVIAPTSDLNSIPEPSSTAVSLSASLLLFVWRRNFKNDSST